MPDNKRKWRILIPDNPDETIKCALYDLYGIVDSYLTYPLAVSEASHTDPAACGENLIIIGTSKDNAESRRSPAPGSSFCQAKPRAIQYKYRVHRMTMTAV